MGFGVKMNRKARSDINFIPSIRSNLTSRPAQVMVKDSRVYTLMWLSATIFSCRVYPLAKLTIGLEDQGDHSPHDVIWLKPHELSDFTTKLCLISILPSDRPNLPPTRYSLVGTTRAFQSILRPNPIMESRIYICCEIRHKTKCLALFET